MPARLFEADHQSRRAFLSGIVAVVAMTIFITWPQALMMRTAFASHVDPYFSAWRIMWFAHALRTDPQHLFDGNIFHPSTGTLAFSDATLLESALAAPFLWAGASPVVVYNTLLVLGIAGSGLAMFVLARYLTERTDAALVAAAIFTMAPYRIAHLMHLELQWAMWMPLTFWALHRAVAERSPRFGQLAGVFIWLQILSSVYYGIFLAIAVAVFAPSVILPELAALTRPQARRDAVRTISGLAIGAALVVVLTWPYAQPYLGNAEAVGERDTFDVAQFSATPAHYVTAVDLNRLWGWTAPREGSEELLLFPGLVALVLATSALAWRPRRNVWPYVAITLLAVELSFGLNGYAYSWLYDHARVLHGLRAPARFAIVAQCGIAVLGAWGVRVLQDRWTSNGARPAIVAAGVLALLAVEYANRPMYLSPVSPPNRSAQDVYRAIRDNGPGVVIELPLPEAAGDPRQDAIYAFWSASHWNKLVNGYSGFYPKPYLQTLQAMLNFPDAASLARLSALDVRYVVVHRAFFPRTDYDTLLLKMATEPALSPIGKFRDPNGEASLFELRRAREP
jgi:hypothetical protein